MTPRSLRQSAPVRPFVNQLVVIGVIWIISRCNIYFAALRKRCGVVWFTLRFDAVSLRSPSITLNVLRGNPGGCGDRFSRGFSRRGFARHLCQTLHGPIIRLRADAATNKYRHLVAQVVARV